MFASNAKPEETGEIFSFGHTLLAFFSFFFLNHWGCVKFQDEIYSINSR